MMNAGNREACCELFKILNILPLYTQYILSLLLFVVENINMFKSNSVVHSINTRHCSDLYLTSVHVYGTKSSVSLRNQSLQLLASKDKKFIQ